MSTAEDFAIKKMSFLEVVEKQNKLLESLIQEIKQSNNPKLKFLEIPDIQKITGWGYNTCRDLFKRKDFPRKHDRQ